MEGVFDFSPFFMSAVFFILNARGVYSVVDTLHQNKWHMYYIVMSVANFFVIPKIPNTILVFGILCEKSA